MNLEDIVRNNINVGYELDEARSKAAQDVILNKIAKNLQKFAEKRKKTAKKH